jgi:hypothetical protein
MCWSRGLLKEGASMRTGQKTYRICSKKRFFIFLLLLVTVSFWVGGYVNAEDSDISASTAYVDVEVRSGDTLWRIAGAYNSEDKDIRQFIYEISEINDIKGGYIYPGDIIKIPVE